MNDRETIKALVVDDEKVVRDFLTRFLNLEGIKVKAVEDGFKDCLGKSDYREMGRSPG